MNPNLVKIIDLRYAPGSDRMSFLARITSYLKPSADITALMALVGSNSATKAVQIAAFAIWLDEISYAWDKDIRKLSIEALKTDAETFDIAYEQVYKNRAQAESLKQWFEDNLRGP